jgi:hypothetical protein
MFRQNSAHAVNVYPDGKYTGGDIMNRFAIILAVVLLGTACNPTVKVEAPDKPIEINMNINIKHEILIKVEKQVEELLEDNMF